ncbi:hypothetical protein BH09BAC4_BH09BAC4_31470 [soil metagenome]
MRTLLFCFANHSHPPLATLQKEYEGIDRLLDARNNLKHFLKVPVPFSSTESVVRKINIYRESLAIFHFSGHANYSSLQLDDSTAGAKGIAKLLGRCPNLKLVFLNGCSTKQHIEQLTAQGIQAVIIATYAPIKDHIATTFSLAFYEALEKQYSLEGAINEARHAIINARADRLELMELTDELTRGMLNMAKEVSDDQWYFYCPNPENAKWKLPTNAETSFYKPNSGIRETLFEALGDQDQSFYDQYEVVQSKYSQDDLTDWVHKQILGRLPYPLAEPLRRLVRREFVQADNQWKPIALSSERLENYLILVDNSMNLVISTYLAQIRDHLLQLKKANKFAEFSIESSTFSFLREVLSTGWLNQPVENLVTTILRLRSLLFDLKIPLFAGGIDGLIAGLMPSSPLYESLLFFQELRHQLTSQSGVPNVEYYSEVGEEHLKPLLERSGFWVNYLLESVRHIRVITYFDLLNSQYSHEKVVLRSTLIEDPTENVLIENEQDIPWSCQSVLLVNRQNEFLNLSPFLIDRNVYKKSNTTFDLYTFGKHQEGKLAFTRLTYPAHPPLDVFLNGPNLNAQEDFTFLRRQLKAIYELIQLSLPVSSNPPRIKPILRS